MKTDIDHQLPLDVQNLQLDLRDYHSETIASDKLMTYYILCTSEIFLI